LPTWYTKKEGGLILKVLIVAAKTKKKINILEFGRELGKENWTVTIQCLDSNNWTVTVRDLNSNNSNIY